VGAGMPEGQGRWSVADQVQIELKHALVGRVRLLFRATGYEQNAGSPIAISVGDVAATAVFPAQHQQDEIGVDFELAKSSNRICLTVPFPTVPPGDARSVGINLQSLRAVQQS